MPTIDETIYVALPDVLGLDADAVGYKELHETLLREASGATSITILGGYMSPDYLRSLCSRVPRQGNGGRRRLSTPDRHRARAVTSLAQQWKELRSLKADLQSDGFCSAEVKVVLQGSVHFHTKLFGFIRSTQPSWYIGSANPSGSNRHELMVRVGRKHTAIAAYANAVLAKAIDVCDETPAEAPTLRAFFRSGFLAHKPPNSRLFTFDAFHFTPAERNQLDDGAGVRLGLRHANPTTEGYGFSLASALEETALRERDGARSKRIKHSWSSVDTVFGFWMPGPYADELGRDYKQEEAARECRLEAFAERLRSKKGMRAAQTAFMDYISDMATLLRERGVKKQPAQGFEGRFTRFLTSRAKLLKDPERRARQARTMVIQEMPDIWPDERSAEAFEESFFDDVSFRASSDNRKGRVISSILDGICDVDTADPDDIRNALERRLIQRPWTDKDWRGQRDI